MQGLFGRFGKKKPVPEIAIPNFNTERNRDRAVDELDYAITPNFDDDEETNWDDAETLENENNPILKPQPIVPATVVPSAATTPDPDNWDEALPAATVKNSNSQEARRGKQSVPMRLEEDLWDEDLAEPSRATSGTLNNNPAATDDRLGIAVGLWAATIQQFRRILPPPLRKLSDAILSALAIALVTVAIWFVDSFALPGVDPSVATAPSPPTAAIPSAVSSAPQINPEQAFVDAIQSQLSEITRDYPAGMISGLQVDAAGDRLIVQLDPVWYTLDREIQIDQLARMWSQARSRNFSKLEVRDTQGKSIARSPVVGREIIILQRQ